ncbi:palmdelphin isoform X3 [Gouania willdenowi]|uniref:Palmdelphin n=1 Tax=Gouania willdenowi TaxID=441366 RepID=A0A8C5HF07_GOUWI|nr:palmdelphin-like isoform X3 [Gouania willdenowi]
MEEADLLKERLQAITDKRKIQEDIAKKRREVEEEKLKLQYIKKKALRDQWLMDGVCQQSEEEQEILRLQAEDEQQQSDQLQSNILRIEKDIEALETQELSISANEEVILKRLKEVERTAEDIIKELKVAAQSDVTHHHSSPDTASFIQLAAKTNSPLSELKKNEQKKASFAIEISVEHNRKTGKSEVVSTATITPETIEEKGLKVYEDGRKSVYAFQPDGAKMSADGSDKMTLEEVEELLHQATEKRQSSEVQYHQPVYSLPYKGTSRPSTPGASNKPHRQTQSLGSEQNSPSFKDGAQKFKHDSLCSEEQKEIRNKNTSPFQRPVHQDLTLKSPKAELLSFQVPGELMSDPQSQPQSFFNPKVSSEITNSKTHTGGSHPASLLPKKVISEEIPGPVQPRAIDGHSKKESSDDFTKDENVLKFANTLPDGLESKPVTMIFMGYENAVNEENEDFQAELVMLSESDDDDDEEEDENDHNNGNHECDEDEFAEEAPLSYHPKGYRSRVFTPRVCLANVVSSNDSNWDDLELHKPTFIHKCGEKSVPRLGKEKVEPANIGSISLEKGNLCLNNDRTLPQSIGC